MGKRTLRDAVQDYLDGDANHNIYKDFGYPEDVTFDLLYKMYRRLGLAKTVVDLPVDLCWMSHPVVEGVTGLDTLITEQKLWQRIKGVDRRQRVGRYAALFFRLRDGKKAIEPVDKKFTGPGAVIEIIPIYEGQLKVVQVDTDERSEAFDQPTMYQYDSGGVSGRSELSSTAFSIHPSRLVLTAEGADDGSIYGQPVLECIFNSLLDARKIIGSGAEGFYKNAAQSIVFKVSDLANASANVDQLEDFNSEFDDFSKNRSRRAMWTPGLDPHTLSSDLISPEHFFDITLSDIAAGGMVQKTILTGMQTGQRASTEDSRSQLARCDSRRENYLMELIRSVIDYCSALGIVTALSNYTVEWDGSLTVNRGDQLENAKKMADVNQLMIRSKMEPVFSEEVVAEEAGHIIKEEEDEDEF